MRVKTHAVAWTDAAVCVSRLIQVRFSIAFQRCGREGECIGFYMQKSVKVDAAVQYFQHLCILTKKFIKLIVKSIKEEHEKI